MPNKLPQPVSRRDLEHERFSRDPGVHRAIGVFIGFGRSVPPEILDDELLDAIATLRLNGLSWEQIGMEFRKKHGFKGRAQLRAVLMNLSRMRRENGGRLPWEQ